MNHIVPKRHLVYSAAFRETLAARRRDQSTTRLRLQLLDRRDSLATLIDARNRQLAQHIEEFDAVELEIAQLEGRST